MTIAYPDMDIWRGRDWSNATADDLADKALAESFGWESLRTLMGGALAIAPTAVRPNTPTCSGGAYYVAPVGSPGILDPFVGIDGRWYNRGLDSWRPAGCACADPRRVRLPGPVGRVESVRVNGTLVPASAYQVVDGEWLVRIDGAGWPRHQDMYALPDAENTFVVTYFRGSAPDELDAYAAGVLAAELHKLIKSGDKATCRLPRNATSVSRQGVTYDLTQSGFSDGKSNIPEVDAIVSRRNPNLLRMPAIVMSVDTMNDGHTVAGPGALVADPANPGFFVTKGA